MTYPGVEISHRVTMLAMIDADIKSRIDIDKAYGLRIPLKITGKQHQKSVTEEIIHSGSPVKSFQIVFSPIIPKSNG